MAMAHRDALRETLHALTRQIARQAGLVELVGIGDRIKCRHVGFLSVQNVSNVPVVTKPSSRPWITKDL